MKCPNCGYELQQSEIGVPSQSVLSDYLDKEENQEVKKAIPQISGYRERFKKRELTIDDIKAKTRIINLPRQDSELDRFGDLIIGEGLVQEI